MYWQFWFYLFSRYYGFAYHNLFSGGASSLLATSHQFGCEDILFNFLISHVTKLPPIRLLQHKWVGDSIVHYHHSDIQSSQEKDIENDDDAERQKTDDIPPLLNIAESPLSDNAEYKQRMRETNAQFRSRQKCMHEVAEFWGDMPLKRSQVRIDPVLYRDDVSVIRKRYRQLEHLPQAFSP